MTRWLFDSMEEAACFLADRNLPLPAIAAQLGQSEEFVTVAVRGGSFPKPRRNIPIDENKLVRLHESGLSLKQLSQQFKISRETVRKRLRRQGVVLRSRGGYHPRRTRQTVLPVTLHGTSHEVIAALHGAQMTVTQIQRSLGRSQSYVVDRLSEAGIKWRTRDDVVGLDPAELARVYQAVQSTPVVGEIFHLSREEARTRLKEYGQPLRHSGARQHTAVYPDASPVRVALAPRPWEQRHQQIIRRYLQGHSTQRIMSDLGISAYEVDQSVRAYRSREPIVAEIALRAAHGESNSRIAVMMGIRVERVAAQVDEIRKHQHTSFAPRALCRPMTKVGTHTLGLERTL